MSSNFTLNRLSFLKICSLRDYAISSTGELYYLMQLFCFPLFGDTSATKGNSGEDDRFKKTAKDSKR